MASQPSSSSTRMSGDGNIRDPLEPKMDLNNFIRQLCNRVEIEISEEDNVTSESFGESVLEFVSEGIKNYNEIKRLVCILNTQVQTPLFQIRVPSVAQFSPGTLSNGEDTSSESSQIPPNETNNLLVDAEERCYDSMPVLSPAWSIESVPITSPRSPEVITLSSPQDNATPNSASSPLCVISSTFHIQTPQQSEINIPQNDNNDNPGNTTATEPAMSQAPISRISRWIQEGSRSPLLLLEDLGQPQSTTEPEVENSFMEEDNFVNELIQPPPPPVSRQLRPRKQTATVSSNNKKKGAGTRRSQKKKTNHSKKTKELISIKKIHKAVNKNGYYSCTCNSKFSSAETQKNHLNYLTSEWKLKCEHCTDKFYNLPYLRKHMTKQHGIENPLTEYVVCCTRCGIMYTTRSDFCSHYKAEHGTNEGLQQPEMEARPGLSPRYPGMSIRRPNPGWSPRRPFGTPRYHGTSPRRPWSTPRYRGPESPPENLMLSSPWDEKIDVEHNYDEEMINQQCNEEEAQLDTSQCSSQQANISPLSPQMDQPNGLMNDDQRESSGNSSVESAGDFNGECFGCKVCPQAFSNFEQLEEHVLERHQSNWDEVKCGLCGIVFGSCEYFREHLAESHFTGSNEQEIDSSQSSQPYSSNSSSSSEMDEQEYCEDITNRNVDLGESSNSFQGSSNLRDYVGHGKLYSCIKCSQAFRNDLESLRRHMIIQHRSVSKEVKCGICGRHFESSANFERHWDLAGH